MHVIYAAAALLVSGSCVAASVRRLQFVVAPTGFDADGIASILRKSPGNRAHQAKVLDSAGARWEAALIDAGELPRGHREASINELVADIDFESDRWKRVPRVAASLSSSSGFLLGALAMRSGLSAPEAFAPETRQVVVTQSFVSALDAVALGIAGAVICMILYVRAGKVAKSRLEAIDRLVAFVEADNPREVG